MATSTLTVTSCVGGCGGGVTVPGPTVVASTTTMVQVTYTTVCPVTVTRLVYLALPCLVCSDLLVLIPLSSSTAAGTTYTQVFTTTSVVVTEAPTTVQIK